MSNRGEIDGPGQSEFSLPVNPKAGAGFADVKTLNGQKQDQFSARTAGFSFPAIWSSLFVCQVQSTLGGEIAFVMPGGGMQHCDCILLEIIASLSSVWFEQTQYTHAEQSCQRQMSAHHSRHITNKSVHPEWLLPPQLEEREREEGSSFSFCPNSSFDNMEYQATKRRIEMRKILKHLQKDHVLMLFNTV